MFCARGVGAASPALRGLTGARGALGVEDAPDRGLDGPVLVGSLPGCAMFRIGLF
jgi:hypothetical protein